MLSPSRGSFRIAVLVALLLVHGSLLRAEEPSSDPSTPQSNAAAEDDSLRAFQDPFAGEPGDGEFTDPFADDERTTDWDSVFAAYDQDFGAGRRKVEPLVGFRYNKAEGVHLDAGLSLRELASRFLAVEMRGGYDFARLRPNGSARVRIGDLSRERWWFDLGLKDGVRPFGSHQPYGNTLFALVGGYDGVQYLRERGWRAGGQLTLGQGVRFDLGFERAQVSPLLAKEDWHLFGVDRWMRENEQATRMQTNAIRFRIEHRPPYSTETVRPGWYASTQAIVHGGSVLGGDREFTRADAALERRWVLRDSHDHLRLATDLGAAFGDAPNQALVDLGGHGGLRGFEPRSYVGTNRAFAMAEYAYGIVWPRKARIPLLGKLRFHVVPFVEAGSIWSNMPSEDDLEQGRSFAVIHDLGDLRRPQYDETRWDLGFGIRRILETSGLLHFAQVDFAWPMGAETGPVRITARLSSRGFD